MGSPLFLSQEHLHGTSEKIKLRAKLILKETPVRLADILRKIAEERKRR